MINFEPIFTIVSGKGYYCHRLKFQIEEQHKMHGEELTLFFLQNDPRIFFLHLVILPMVSPFPASALKFSGHEELGRRGFQNPLLSIQEWLIKCFLHYWTSPFEGNSQQVQYKLIFHIRNGHIYNSFKMKLNMYPSWKSYTLLKFQRWHALSWVMNSDILLV